MNVVVTGSIAYDYLMTFPGYFKEHILPEQIAKLSVSFLVDSMRKQRGGCAPNIAYNLALLGERPLVMGDGGPGLCRVPRLAGGAWCGHVGGGRGAGRVHGVVLCQHRPREQPDRVVLHRRDGARAASFPSATSRLPVDLAIISPNDPEAMRKYPRECKALGIPYIYDPSQQIIRLSGDDLREGIDGCKMLIVNEYEFEMIRNKTGMSEAAGVDAARARSSSRAAVRARRFGPMASE